MKTITLLLVLALPAYAAEPALEVIESDTPVLAPDVPGVSVRLRAGEVAPFDGRLVQLDENLRRGRELVDCRAELEAAKANTWVSKPVLVALIVGGVVLGAAAGAGVTAWALRR